MREALPQDLLDTGLLQDDDVDVGRNSGKVRAKSRAYRRPESDEQGLTRSPVFDRTGVDTAAHKDMDPPRTCGRPRRCNDWRRARRPGRWPAAQPVQGRPRSLYGALVGAPSGFMILDLTPGVAPRRSVRGQTKVTLWFMRSAAGLANGLVDFKIAATDETWSGLRFALVSNRPDRAGPDSER